MAFGKTLKVMRRQAGLKQDALAYDVGVATQTVSFWETGKMLPSGRSLMYISAAVKVPISRMFAATERAMHLQRILAAGGRITTQHMQEQEDEDPGRA